MWLMVVVMCLGLKLVYKTVVVPGPTNEEAPEFELQAPREASEYSASKFLWHTRQSGSYTQSD